MEAKKKVTVLLTRYYSTFSNFVYWISGRGYTHASIALNDENDCYYSFNFKGFRREYPGRKKRKCGKSVSFELELSEESYMQIEKVIHQMEQDSNQYHYSRIGVFMCLLHIPFKMKRRYFCSQFVMEMLSLTGSISLRKKPCLYLPNHLPEELQRQKCLLQVNYNLI